jgi:hypothetical protein
LDQNSIMIYHKFNGDFKSHIKFGRTRRRCVALLMLLFSTPQN